MFFRLMLAMCLYGSAAIPAFLPTAARAQARNEALDPAIASLFERAERNLSAGLHLSAKGEFQQALQMAQAQQSRIGQLRALVGLARVEYLQGRYASARPLLQRADRLASTPVERGPILSVRGAILLEQGDYRDARQALQQGLHFLQVGGSRDRLQRAAIQRTRIDLGRTLGFLGWYDRALALLQSAASASSDNNNRQLALQAIGDVQFELGQYRDARENYQWALGAPGSRDRLRRAQIVVRLGQTQQVLGELDAAEDLYQQALGQIRGLGAWSQQVFALNFLGQVAAERGEPERALAFFEDARATFSSSGGVGRVLTLLNLAHFYRQQGDLKQAIEFFEEALQWAQSNGDRVGIVRARSGLGQSYLEQREVTAAVRELEASTVEFEQLRPGLRDDQKIALFETQKHTYRLLQRAYVLQGNFAAALLAAERSRARAFVELLARRLSEENSAAPPAPPTLAEIFATARDRDVTLVSYSILYDDRQQETDVFVWVVTPTGELTFHQQPLVAEQTALTASVTESRRSAADGRGLQNVVAEIRSGARGESVAPAGLAAAEQSDRDPSLQPTQQAYRLLIEPIANLLPTDPEATIVFVPDGPLFLLPMPALQDTDGTYLIDRHTMAMTPSIQALALTRALPNLSLERATIVGNPAPFPADLVPLPGAEAEAEAIGQLLAVQPLIGNQATEQALRDALPQASLIHLATHGFFDARQGLQSSIALASTDGDDGFLTAEEILDLDLQASLAVLSACDTGRGQITGDGVIGLSRSLMSVGVPSTIVTLWAIPDRPTAELMTEFYRQLQQDPDKVQALRQAMLATKEKYPKPRDWASFVLIGRPD
ncbi:MAG: CHAT domain-containing protein [Cyanobacteria bacterium J06641_5]